MSILRGSDRMAILGNIDPDAYAASTVATGWISMAKWDRLLAVVQAGDLGTNATLDAKLRQATDGAGTGAKDITGKAITQMTQAGTDKSNKQALINLRAEELDVNNGFTHVQLSMTIATATSDAGGMVLGLDPRYPPAVDSDAASVDQVVS